jgi:uncharacterized alkaline shock family protein YloU
MTDVEAPGQSRAAAELAATGYMNPPTAMNPPAASTLADAQPGAPASDPFDRANDPFDRAGDAIDRAGEAIERAAAASGRVASHVVDRLRNNAELTADRGTTSIADEVVEKIAGIATRDVPGVYDLGGDVSRTFASVRERIGLGKAEDDSDRGISVKLEGSRAKVEITLVIEYGHVVQEVSTQVRANVISAVERMLNLQVTEVNIVVDDVHVPDPEDSRAA